MPGLRTRKRCARRHSHAVLRCDDRARTSSRLRLSELRLETICHGITSSPEHDTDDAGRPIINTQPEIVVASRDFEMRDGYREQVTDRLGNLERYNSGVTRYEVELGHEPNPRQSKTSLQVTITGHGTGPTVHAEGCGTDFRSALDGAVGKLEEQLRRRRDRRVRHGRDHRATVDLGQVSTPHLVSDDASAALQPQPLTAPEVTPLSSGGTATEAASSSTPPWLVPNATSPWVRVADGAGVRSARDSNFSHPES
jgi:ribosomal subunit interface protein